MNSFSDVGVVAIGRNEGERLHRCLRSTDSIATHIVYVDSGSSDGSIEWARANEFEVVLLDSTTPFTAARARNAGFQHLIACHTKLMFMQFVDGDCEVVEGWLNTARIELTNNPDVAIVCGRRRERYVKNSVYNLLCDMEWDTPIGETDVCGGDFMIRVDAFQQVGGFNSNFIAGEEPELCLRLKKKDWRILRLDHDMTIHDAAITTFSQWWKRVKRSGHAYAETTWLHQRASGNYGIKSLISIVFWGVALIFMVVALLTPTRGLSALLLTAYVFQWRRIRDFRIQRGDSLKKSGIYAAYTLVGKPAQALGAIQFFVTHLLGRRKTIIEYK